MAYKRVLVTFTGKLMDALEEAPQISHQTHPD